MAFSGDKNDECFREKFPKKLNPILQHDENDEMGRLGRQYQFILMILAMLAKNIVDQFSRNKAL